MLKRCAVPRSFVVFATLAVASAMLPAARGETAPASQRSQAGDAPSSPTATPALEALGWLRGCWLGSVNRREFLEQWSPPRGGMMVGFSHTVVSPRPPAVTLKERMDAPDKVPHDSSSDRTQDFEYLRLEQRPDGVYYVAVPSGKKEVTFKLREVTEESGVTVFSFSNVVDEFPQRLIYRRGKEGWLYAQVTGEAGVSGSDVVYPMQHVDCQSDALLKE